MDHHELIFQCLYQITLERDQRSLEKNLLQAVAQLLPPDARLAVIHYHTRDQTYSYTHDHSGYKLSLCKNSEKTLECFIDGHLINEIPSIESGTNELRYLFPIRGGRGVIAILEVHSKQLTQSASKTVSNILSIYGNYVSALMDGERDTLTGLLNRKNFEDHFSTLLHIQEEQSQLELDKSDSQRIKTTKAEHSSWLVMVDIDHFKRVNDEFGHVIGDEVILILSQQMKTYFRRNDLIFRFGGEEFLLLLNNVSYNHIYNLIERFRTHIEQCEFPKVNNISISLGYTAVDREDYSLFAIERADQALYWSKEQGRNQTTPWEQLRDEGEVEIRNDEAAVSLF